MSTQADSNAATILVADDDEVVRRLLERDLREAGYQVVLAEDGTSAQKAMSDDVAAALLDLSMPGATGMQCLKVFREKFPHAAVMLISGTGDIEDAVEAMRQGAFDYFSKPYNRDHILVRVRQAVNSYRLACDNQQLRQAVSAPASSVNFVGQSGRAKELLAQIERVSQLESTVLITGASGTGKTTLARMIHEGGDRARFPFVAVSCAALPRDLIEAELFGYERGAFTGAVNARPGRAEVAHRGTLFLDEIGDLPLELQPKLLTFLQDHCLQRIGGNEIRRVDVRVIAATHQNLEAMCESKDFRQDLYFRLAVLAIQVPPLSDRREDIPELVDETLDRIAQRRGSRAVQVDRAARQLLAEYDWPGNVRELENVLERASAFCQDGVIQTSDVQLRSPTGGGADSASNGGFTLAGKTLSEIECEAIRETLNANGGNKAAAARQLGISEKSIYNKMKRHGLFESKNG